MPPSTPPAIPLAPRPAPRSKTDLFFSFSLLALQGFGGVLAVAQRELVERKQWLTAEEFVEDWAVAQILPGPNVVNLSLMLGDRYFGWRGALAGVAGMLSFPLVLVLLLAAAFAGVADDPQAQGALRGMGAVAAGLIIAAGLRLVPALKSNVMGLAPCVALMAATFAAVALLRVPLLWVLLSIGGLGCAWAYVCLGRLAAKKEAA
jgi:chromate transporter